MRRILSRHQGPPREAIGICILWRNVEGGLKDKQMGDFILIMGLRPFKQIAGPFFLPKENTYAFFFI